MNLEVVGAGVSLDERGFSLSFDVTPEHYNSIRLKTGEIFQNRVYPAYSEPGIRHISAKIYVARQEQSAGSPTPVGEIRYHPGFPGDNFEVEESSEIWLTWKLPAEHLDRLCDLVLNGVTPKSVAISLEGNGLQYRGIGEEEVEWDNKTHPKDSIRFIGFWFGTTLPGDRLSGDEAAIDNRDRAFFADTAEVNYILLKKLRSIDSCLQRIAWGVALLGLILLVLTLRRP